jgi:hypothetical protein
MEYTLQFTRNKERAYVETILAWNEDSIEYSWRSVIGDKRGYEFQRSYIV